MNVAICGQKNQTSVWNVNKSLKSMCFTIVTQGFMTTAHIVPIPENFSQYCWFFRAMVSLDH